MQLIYSMLMQDLQIHDVFVEHMVVWLEEDYQIRNISTGTVRYFHLQVWEVVSLLRSSAWATVWWFQTLFTWHFEFNRLMLIVQTPTSNRSEGSKGLKQQWALNFRRCRRKPDHAACLSRLKVLRCNPWLLDAEQEIGREVEEVARWKILQETMLRWCPGIYKQAKIIQPLYDTYCTAHWHPPPKCWEYWTP